MANRVAIKIVYLLVEWASGWVLHRCTNAIKAFTLYKVCQARGGDQAAAEEQTEAKEEEGGR